MKQISTLIIFCATFANLNAAVGCMDDSRHLRENFDTKALHYVKCDCPCRTAARGTHRCRTCGHIMIARETEYISQVDVRNIKQQKIMSLMQNPDKELKRLIQKYHETKNK